MTAWQDQPPVSRRHVRQTERDENVDSQSNPMQNAPGDTSFAGIARLGWEAEARRATAPQGSPESPIEPAITRGRRVQQPATNEPAAGTEPEPLRYLTHARPQTPSYDGMSSRAPVIGASPQDIGASSQDTDAPTQVEPAPAAEQPDYRTRDLSASDSRRSAFRAVGPPLDWEPPVVVALPEPVTAPVIESADSVLPSKAPEPEPVLTRRQMRELGIGGFVTTPSENDEGEQAAAVAASLQAQPESAPITAIRVEEAPVEEAPIAEAPIDVAPVAEASIAQVATGRLRFRDRASRTAVDPELEREEARRAEGLAASAQIPSSIPDPASEPPALVEPPALIEPPALVEPPVRPPFTGAIPTDITVAELMEPASPIAAVSIPVEFVSTPVFTVDLVVDPEVVEPEVVVAELEPHSEQTRAFEELLFPSGQPVETAVEPLPADSVEATFGAFLAGQDIVAPTLAEPEEPIAAADGAYVPPVGHWSTQALIDDDEQVQENTFARDVGATSGAITTSALVLPSMPTGEDIMGPLSGTGEILITGSINLPSSIGSTGVHPARYDHSDVDALLEADDREDSSDPDSAPVRAIRAISTNTASGDVINSMRPQKASRLPLILIVSAAVMAVGVVVLLVAGFIFKVF
jgi:hypothetical protein